MILDMLKEHLAFELKRLQRKLNITFIYVTHDQEEALQIPQQTVLRLNLRSII